jgi:hypothetical protein
LTATARNGVPQPGHLTFLPANSSFTERALPQEVHVQPSCAIFCARCSAELHPGRGDFFQVTIEAVADPSPPVVDDADPEEIRRGIENVLRELNDLTAQEAMDQVHRRLVLHLCGTCYRDWIENPVG